MRRHELATLRGSEAYVLAGADETEREAYLTTHRAVLRTDRDRLTVLLAQQPAPAAGAADAIA